jgi:hypothetical protein
VLKTTTARSVARRVMSMNNAARRADATRKNVKKMFNHTVPGKYLVESETSSSSQHGRLAILVPIDQAVIPSHPLSMWVTINHYEHANDSSALLIFWELASTIADTDNGVEIRLYNHNISKFNSNHLNSP